LFTMADVLNIAIKGFDFSLQTMLHLRVLHALTIEVQFLRN